MAFFALIVMPVTHGYDACLAGGADEVQGFYAKPPQQTFAYQRCSFLRSQERTKERNPDNLLVSFTYSYQKGACYCALPFDS